MFLLERLIHLYYLFIYCESIYWLELQSLQKKRCQIYDYRRDEVRSEVEAKEVDKKSFI